MFDSHANFGYSTVLIAPAPPNSGTSLTVAAGQGALFPTAPFNCTVWPADVQPLASNAEIVRVTAVAGDTLTIVRAQEGTGAIAIAAGYQIANTTSVKVFTDIETAIAISAGTQNFQGPFTFADANGITFGMDNGTVTGSVAPAAGGGVGISAGGNSQSTGTVTFANSNGITFGLDGAGVMTAAHDGITSQSNPAFSASGGSSTFQTLNFANSNGLTFLNSNGSVIASYTVPNTAGLISFVNFSAGTTSNNLAAITFANANGITFGLNAGVMTASVAAGAAPGSISAGTQTFALGQAILSNANGITFGMDNGTITASHNGLTSQSNQAASASNGSFAFQTLGFTNANGVTFGTSAGSLIFASVAAGAAPGSISAGTQTFALGQLVFADGGGITFGLNAGTLTAVHNGLTSQSNQAASASNGSFTFQTLGFSNANGVTFGTSAGSIITASVAAAAGNTISFFEVCPYNNNVTSLATPTQNQPWLDPITPQCAISFRFIAHHASFNMSVSSSGVAVSGSHTLSQEMAIFSRSVTDSGATNFSNSSNWVTMWTAVATTVAAFSVSGSSLSISYAWQTNSTGGSSTGSASTNSSGFSVSNVTGQKIINFPYATSMPAGEYIMFQNWRSSTSGNALASSLIRVSIRWMTMQSNLSMGTAFGAPAITSGGYVSPRLGFYSATTTAVPSTLAETQINQQGVRRIAFLSA